MTIAERFLEKILISPFQECWEWLGCKNNCGYGEFRNLNKKVKSHRFSYELFNGAIPRGSVVMHKCDNRGCVNPSHLSIGTQKENIADSVNKKKHPAGERNGRSKLTSAQVQEIRRRGSLVSNAKIAKEFGISPRHIRDLLSLKKWKPT